MLLSGSEGLQVICIVLLPIFPISQVHIIVITDTSYFYGDFRSAEAFLTPKSHTSQSDMLLDALQKRSQSLRVKRLVFCEFWFCTILLRPT